MNLYSSSSSEDEEEVNRRRPKRFCARINFDFEYENQFHQTFRMSPACIESVLLAIGPHIQHTTGKSGALTPKQQLCVTLNWMGSGSQFHTIGRVHGIHESSVQRSVVRVVGAVNRYLLRHVVALPANPDEEMNRFHNIAQFPNVVGVVDGSLIPIDAPSNNEFAFVDRKGQHSLNCMFVCGSSLQFFYVNSNWPGSLHDSRVLRLSSFYDQMEQGNIFPNAVFLGDSGYPLKTWLMTPLHHDPYNPGERRYNRRLKETRRLIECALGILKEKFPCLNHLRVKPRLAANVVKCCTALCNIARRLENNNLVLPDHNEDPELIEEGHYEGAQQPDAIRRQQEIIQQMM